jgi:hypothetical protein
MNQSRVEGPDRGRLNMVASVRYSLVGGLDADHC